ncbi:MAG: WG repeat-containing protein [Flavobacteriales bacterium]|nr:WG repeat-containing protein [Flavobacteriales bacterium]
MKTVIFDEKRHLKTSIITLTLILLSACTATAQEDYWVPFWNNDRTLFGFKTGKGEVKIAPKYVDFAPVNSFDNFNWKFEDIVAVGENEGNQYKSYYLTKSGDTFGHDRLYFNEAGSVDCESEGYIRFTDKNGQVGLYDGSGEVVIPAIYNELSTVQNGLLWAKKDADKIYDEGDSSIFYFINGQRLLLNTKGEVLISDFNTADYNPFDEIDPYSMQISREEYPDTTKFSILGENGVYYTFSNFKQHFEEWLDTFLVNNLTRSKFEEVVADQINCRGYFSKNYLSPTLISDSSFLDAHFELIQFKLREVHTSNVDWFVTKEALNPLAYSRETYAHYYDNCGKPRDIQYPLMKLVVNRDNQRQDTYDFLKVDNDRYILIGLKIDRE